MSHGEEQTDVARVEGGGWRAEGGRRKTEDGRRKEKRGRTVGIAPLD
jgi:hypothetical protein